MQYVRTNIGLVDEDIFQVDIQLLDVYLILTWPFSLDGLREVGPEVGRLEVRCGSWARILKIEATVSALFQTVDGTTVSFPGIIKCIY